MRQLTICQNVTKLIITSFVNESYNEQEKHTRINKSINDSFIFLILVCFSCSL